MKKEYVFYFQGTKEDFLNKINPDFNSTNLRGNEFYYFDDYIVKIVGDTIHFGVERGGHSSGYWYIPTITAYDDRIEFCGTVEYIGPANDSSGNKKSTLRSFFSKLGDYLLYIILAPLIIIVYVIVRIVFFFKWIINKALRQPTEKPKSTEERLFDLMENHLGCIGKDNI